MADLNIPSGEGLLDTQQKEAADIPYKNIALADASIKNVMNTFMVAQQVGNKRRQLEQQLQESYLKNDLQEREFNWKMDNANTQHAIQLQGLGLRAAAAENSAQNAAERIQIARDTLDFKGQRDLDKANDTSGAMNDLADLSNQGYKVGTPGYDAAIYRALANHPNVPASTKNALLHPLLQAHKDSIESQAKAIDTEERNLRTRWSLDTYGVPNKGDINPLLEPQKWFKPEYKTTSGGSEAVDQEGKPDKQGGRIQFVVDKNGNKVETGKATLLLNDPNNPEVPTRKTMSMLEVTRYKQELADLRSRRARLAPLPHDPGVGVTSRIPSDYDIQTLRNNPNLATRFDSRFGNGESQKYLQ